MNGIIMINKEKGWTSNDIVQKVKHIFNGKTGHTGTLDPLATGVLPILIGKGTGLSKYLINHDKEYVATIKLGQKTTTGDSEGEIIEQKDVTDKMLQEEFVKKILQEFKGKQSQVPPIYSAIKVNGKKLYEYARKGQEVEIEPREVEIYDIELVSILKDKKEIIYRVNCSKGTYIRTLCEDIANKLGTVGFMKELNRTRVGDFDIDQAVKISEIIDFKSANEIIQMNNSFISIEKFFKDKKIVELDDIKLNRFLNGLKIYIPLDNGIYKVYDKNKIFIGIGVVKDNKIKRDLII